MSCAACQARVEKAVKEMPGITFCAVNLLTNSMLVEGSAKTDEIIKTVEHAGYGAEPSDEKGISEESLENKETPRLVKRLVASAVLTLLLMYISMGHFMWGFPMPSGLDDATDANAVFLCGVIEGILSLAVIIINRKFFINGARGLIKRAPNMDTLVSLGSGISFIYSVVLLLAQGAKALYFESAAMILTLITVGKLLESISKGRTTDAIKGLIKLIPKTAIRVEGGVRTEVSVQEIQVGDKFLVDAGMSVPVDGMILEGSCRMDESALTGESEAVEKRAGDHVSAATINIDGEVTCTATKVGTDTTLAQIIKTVENANAGKAPIARIADKVAGVFVPVVIGLACITFIVWMIAGGDSESVRESGVGLLSYALMRGISVLVISCPCALGLATPVAIMVGSGVGSKHGILFKTAAALENAGKANVAVLDKTGTITTGEVGADKLKPDSKEGVAELKRLGISVVMLSGDKRERAAKIAAEAGIKYVVAGVLPNGKGDVIKKLKKPFAGEGELLKPLPERMLAAGRTNNVIMVGDGINDAPALKVSDLGFAIGAGKDIAIDAADVVLMNSSVKDVAAAIRLSRRTVLNIKENLFWAFIYNIICIPLAAGVYNELLHISLSPMVGALAMALSSFCVCMNALRLNLYDPTGEGKRGGADGPDLEEAIDRINEGIEINAVDDENVNNIFDKKTAKEGDMRKVIKIEGMMCTHCSGRVKDALEKLAKVEAAEVSHETGEAVLSLKCEISDEILIKCVEDAGYKVLGVE